MANTRGRSPGLGTPVGAWVAGQARSVDVAGPGSAGGVPADATAVVATVTAVAPTAAPHLTVWPAGQAMPVASNVNTPAGDTRPNLVVVKLGPGGTVSVFNNSGSTHVLADVVGYLR